MRLAMHSEVDSDTLPDLDGFERLYGVEAESILRFFAGRTGSAETAADLTAETFAAALESWESYKPSKGSPRQWLFGIARNQLSRYLRWRRIDSRARERLGMQPRVDLDSESRQRIEDLVDLKDRLSRMGEALESLSPKLAAAVKLRVMSRLEYAQIAEHLGISQAAARARVSRGLSRLADAFEEEV